jgi:hypothetical protein
MAALAVLAAGCGPAAAAGSGSSSPSQPAEQPLVTTWQLGGAYTGPIPPVTGLPHPTGGLRFGPVTGPRGYREQVTFRFGVPLHYNIPRVLEDCYTAYPNYRSDLDPGMYVIPVQAIITNKTPQEAPAFDPAIVAVDANDNLLPMTDELHMTLGNGSCRMDVYQNMPAGGQATYSGFIGPMTAAQLADTQLRIGDGGINAPGHLYPLTRLEPHRTASWLIANS